MYNGGNNSKVKDQKARTIFFSFSAFMNHVDI